VPEAALETITREFTRDAEILGIIGELRDVFENNFDRTWFSLIIDGMPIDFRTVREIREMVSLTAIYPGEEWQLFQGVLELETFYKNGEALPPACPARAPRHLLAIPAQADQGPAPDHIEKVRRIYLPLQPRAPAPPQRDAESPAPVPLPLPGVGHTRGRERDPLHLAF
jgi:hypothetical protein